MAAAPGTKPDDQEIPGSVSAAQENQAKVALEAVKEEKTVVEIAET